MIKFEYTLQIEPAQIGKAFINAKDFEQILMLEEMVKMVEYIGHDKWAMKCQCIRDGFIVLGNDKKEVAIAQKDSDDLRYRIASMLDVLTEHLRKE